ncbi:MAG: 16S rRNA (cytosine(967)-C(5))-methyltransferase RsmB [Oscillospiraceae bacterium]|nr:16S rRNA (cytosine(967)-C(5))-methyltransferase RsmB [Oscillospiraceae bacterium]
MQPVKENKTCVTAREVAVKAIIRVDNDGGYSNIVVEKLLRSSGLDSRDIAFASAIVYGTLEHLVTIDYMLEFCSGRKISQMQPEVAGILRTAACQLMYMSSVPESAAVNEAVELTRKMKAAKASGFVNAVLRSLIRQGKKADLNGLSGVKRLSVEYSCSKDAVRIYLSALGDAATKEFLEDSLGKPPVYARVNTLKNTTEEFLEYCESRGVTAVPHSIVPNCVELREGFTASNYEGRMHIQDVSSQICAITVDAKPGMKVLDVCGAPGGKAFTIAETMENNGSLISCDLHANRLSLIRSGAEKLGITCIEAMQNDASKPNDKFESYDRILCDVPCSGLGVIRRKPEIKYKNLDSLEELYNIQYKILETSSKYLKKDGLLVYSTCTLNKKENGEIVERFLAENPDFEPHNGVLIGGEPRSSATFLPKDMGGDGFFIAVFRRKQNGAN